MSDDKLREVLGLARLYAKTPLQADHLCTEITAALRQVEQRAYEDVARVAEMTPSPVSTIRRETRGLDTRANVHRHRHPRSLAINP